MYKGWHANHKSHNLQTIKVTDPSTRFCQVLKGAVGTTLCQNEAKLKFSMEIDHHTSSTDQAGKIRLTDFPCLFCGWILVEISMENFSSASFCSQGYYLDEWLICALNGPKQPRGRADLCLILPNGVFNLFAAGEFGDFHMCVSKTW